MPHATSMTAEDSARFERLIGRLDRMSTETYYNPYTTFEWPDALPAGMPWMSPSLLSVAGTAVAGELGIDQLLALGRWESVNFYSLNVHGIRDLLTEVVDRIHTPGFEVPSSFFHHFIGEENEHMWFFAEFCLRYAGKIYPNKRLATDEPEDAELRDFLVFARIVLFEEIVDFYNVRMADDPGLCETVRRLNAVHHRDESRHIAFGRELVRWLHARLAARGDERLLADAETYLKRYLVFSLQSLYNPAAYRDAGLADPLALRRRLLDDPARDAFHAEVLRKPVGFMIKSGIFSSPELPAL